MAITIVMVALLGVLTLGSAYFAVTERREGESWDRTIDKVGDRWQDAVDAFLASVYSTIIAVLGVGFVFVDYLAQGSGDLFGFLAGHGLLVTNLVAVATAYIAAGGERLGITSIPFGLSPEAIASILVIGIGFVYLSRWS